MRELIRVHGLFGAAVKATKRRVVRRALAKAGWAASGAALMIAVSPALAVADHLVTIKTGSINGVYYPAGGAICRLVNQGRSEHRIRCAVEASSGSVENLRAVVANEADFGIVQSDVQFSATRGSGAFAGQSSVKSLRALFSLHAEPFTVVARIDSQIKTFDDLKGKRVGIGEPKSGTRATMDLIMSESGITRESFSSVLELPPIQTGAALCENKIDAFVYVVGHPNGAIRNVMETCATRLVPVTGAAVDRLLASHKYYSQANVPNAIYPGVDRDVKTFGVRASVVVHESMPERMAYTVTKAVFEKLSDFRALHPAFRTLTPEQMLQGNTAPWHPGALRYFKEVGLIKS